MYTPSQTYAVELYMLCDNRASFHWEHFGNGNTDITKSLTDNSNQTFYHVSPQFVSIKHVNCFVIVSLFRNVFLNGVGAGVVVMVFTKHNEKL